jgi:DNA-binding CsgD family transcriptional regulator
VDLLTRGDFRAVLEFLQGCYAIQDLDGFVAHVLSNLPKLVPSEATVYTEYNHRRNRVFWRQEPADFAFSGSERIWERYSHEHPFVDHFRKTKDGRAVKFSDFVSAREFRRTSLYNEFFRPLNIRHQMTFLLQEPGSLLSAIALNRGAKDFAERERLILNLLRPHLMQAYRNAEAVTELQQELTQVRGALEKLDRGVIFLSVGGKVQGMTEPAREWLRNYFGEVAQSGDRLPEDLEQWVRQQKVVLGKKDGVPPPGKPLVIERPGKQLSVRLVSEPNQNLLLLQERRTALDLSVLERIGLTRREAEVLSWITYGKTSGEIGRIIGSSPRTVEKHVERILQKLSVETRTAAAARALQLMHEHLTGAF